MDDDCRSLTPPWDIGLLMARGFILLSFMASSRLSFQQAMQFETFRVDRDTRQLFRGDEEVHVSPKAYQLLLLLIDKRPKAVSKQDIHDHLWPKTFVAESNLASIVNEVRTAIGDDARSPKYIRTVHGFGYSFLADPVAGSVAEPRKVAAAKLVWEKGEEPLYQGRNIIGREGDATIRVDDRTISRHHAAVTISDRRATVEDLDSKNGTFVDGVRVTATTDLRDGNVLEVGSVKMVYREFSTLSTQTMVRPGKN